MPPCVWAEAYMGAGTYVYMHVHMVEKSQAWVLPRESYLPCLFKQIQIYFIVLYV